jgi:hypothetical protein
MQKKRASDSANAEHLYQSKINVRMAGAGRGCCYRPFIHQRTSLSLMRRNCLGSLRKCPTTTTLANPVLRWARKVSTGNTITGITIPSFRKSVQRRRRAPRTFSPDLGSDVSGFFKNLLRQRRSKSLLGARSTGN